MDRNNFVATRKAKSSFADTINAYANVSIALFDAFISCWDENGGLW